MPLFRRTLACGLIASLCLSPVARAAEASLPALGDASSQDLSPLAERKLGETIMREATEDGDILDDPETTEYLNALALPLIAHAPPSSQQFHFFAVLDPNINAFALPGGFIGVHSGLIIATQSESELASVMSHEMGHVIQRHIARGIGQDKADSLIALAATIVGMLAMAGAHGNGGGDAGSAAVSMGQGFAIQDQLKFSRDAEREADRVGFQILQSAGFDVSAMAAFFVSLDKATRVSETGTPEWLRDHPMTSERIADIQNRIGEVHYRQRLDALDFYLIRVRLRVLQDITVQGLLDVKAAFEEQLRTGRYANEASIHYGLACALIRLHKVAAAQLEYAKASKLAANPDPMIMNLGVQLLIDEKNPAAALALAREAHAQFPASRMLAARYAETLEGAGHHDEAIVYLRDQIVQYREEAALYQLLAKSYSAEGNAMLSHKALAENYYLRGSVTEAIEQLRQARASSNGDFYELSQIDARMHALQLEWEDIKKEKKDKGSSG